MKRWLILALAAAFLLSSACAAPWKPEGKEEAPVCFYYAAGPEAPYSGDTGALVQESRELISSSKELTELLGIYLTGPASMNARSPFPDGLRIVDAQLERGALHLIVSDQWASLSALDARLAEACLVLTAAGLSGAVEVSICTQEDIAQGRPCQWLQPDDYLLFDDSATSDQVMVRLYFSDLNGRYLVEEVRSHSAITADALPVFILERLLEGPEGDNALPVLPEGTNLLGVELSQGLCTVNLSEAFLTNRPKTHAQARMAVFAVTNSLTELPQVDQVRFLCVGKPIGDYGGLNLSQPLYREELALKNDRGAGLILDANLCVPCGEKLAAIPVQIRQSAGKTGIDAVINALLSFKPGNGYENPFPEGTALVGQIVRDGLCSVTFNNAFALRSGEPEKMETAVRSLVATLCTMEEIDQVEIMVFDSTIYSDWFGKPMVPQDDWFLP